jgi:CubicO group peptidase (beta-lactamase class C family)
VRAVLALLAGLSLPAGAQVTGESGTTSARAALVAHLDSMVQGQASHVPSLSVVVLRGHDTLLARAYGLADREAKRPATQVTIYEIASLTKQITASAIMRLVERGKLRLDDVIDRYVPEFPLGSNRVTVRELLNHTSGVHNYTDDPGFPAHMAADASPAVVLGWIAGHPFDFAPGTRSAYSNTGYTLLGLIIERVSGQSYAEFVERAFFAPLGLHHTSYCRTRSTDPMVAKGYTTRDSQFVRAADLSMTIPFAAGAICATAGDYAAWERAFLDGRVVSAESARRMTTPETLRDGTVLSYGFGLGIGQLGNRPAFEHGGGINGFSSAQVVLPRDSVVVVVFSNNEAYRPEPLTFDLARVVVGYAANGFGALDRPGHVSRP